MEQPPTSPNASASGDTEYRPPNGSDTEHRFSREDGTTFDYRALAEWILLREKERPVAEIFYVAYLQQNAAAPARPVTFVFNGGPGAASAYLHMGGVGPQRVVFEPNGTAGPPPARIVDNLESWLSFTDLVFVDPVGTGFSRMVDNPPKNGADPKHKGSGSGVDDGEGKFYALNRDLSALGEFMGKCLSRHQRWESPIFVAGESYGGFRAAKLTRLLQEGFGIGLNGAILISPALELSLLDTSDYDVLPWVDVFPSMGAAAAHHGLGRWSQGDTPLATVLRDAEAFATERLPQLLISGHAEARVTEEAASLVGLPAHLIRQLGGRLSPSRFTRELLAHRGLVCGLYDASVTARDPFPHRERYRGPDPTLFGIERVFTAGINTHLRRTLQVDTERDYHLLSMAVNKAWKIDGERHALESQVGAADDLRYAMSLNPHMQVRISHGYYDLVTPYFSSNRLAGLMGLGGDAPTGRAESPVGAPAVYGNLSLKHYLGGHMFYTWDASRRAFRDDIRHFYSRAQSPTPGRGEGLP